MISFRPGQQIKEFSILRKSTTLSEKGRVAKSEGEVIGTLKGTITAAKQTEQLKYGKQEHPSTHTVVVKRKTIRLHLKPEHSLILMVINTKPLRSGINGGWQKI